MAKLNGFRVVLLTAIVALAILGVSGILLADSYQGVIVALISPTIVALVGLLRTEQARQRSDHAVQESKAAKFPEVEETERLP